MAFIEGHVRQSKGRWAGAPMVVEPWEAALLHELFKTDRRGHRHYTEALVGLPRKNGKSTLGAAIALYLLVADQEPGPEVYSAAASKEQARIVFEEASRMVLASPVLADRLVVRRSHIEYPEVDGIYRVLAADAPRVHGLNPSGVVIDELHAHKNPELYYALTTGSMAREQPLAVSITTAGFDRTSILHDVFQRGLTGQEQRLLMWWLGAKEDPDSWEDRDLWRACNPASWVTMADLENEWHRLPPAVFARLHLNAWTASEQAWLPSGAWTGCEGQADVEEGEEIWVGVDIGLRHDRSAVAVAAPAGDVVRVSARVFEPAEAGGRLDLAPVENYLRQLGQRYTVREVSYDPHFFQRSAEDLSEQLPMVEFPMTNARTVPASQLLYDLVVGRQVVHDGDPVLAAHVAAASVRETERGWRISKARSKQPIDALVALMMAVGRAMGEQAADPDVFFVSA